MVGRILWQWAWGLSFFVFGIGLHAVTIETFVGGGCSDSWGCLIDGSGMQAGFEGPRDVIRDIDGGYLAVDYDSIRKISATGDVSTLFTEDYFDPWQIDIDSSGNIYVTASRWFEDERWSDEGVIKLDRSGNVLQSWGYSQAYDDEDEISWVNGLVIDENDRLFISEWKKNKILELHDDGSVSVLLGSGESDVYQEGSGTQASIADPWGMTKDAAGNLYVVSHDNQKDRFSRFDTQGNLTHIYDVYNNGNQAPDFAVDTDGAIYYLGGPTGAGIYRVNENDSYSIISMAVVSYTDPDYIKSSEIDTPTDQPFHVAWEVPYGLMLDNDGSLLVATSSGYRIHQVTLETDSPVISEITESDGSNGSKDYTVTVSDDHYVLTVQCQMNGGEAKDAIYGSQSPSYYDAASQSFSFNFDADTFGDDDRTISCTATDNLGKTATKSEIFNDGNSGTSGSSSSCLAAFYYAINGQGDCVNLSSSCEEAPEGYTNMGIGICEDQGDGLDYGLVAHYEFDGDVTDSGGNGYDATESGVSYVTEIHSQVASLTDNSKITLPSYPELQGSDVTLSVWYYADNGNGNVNTYLPNIMQGTSDTYQAPGFSQLYINLSTPNHDTYPNSIRFDVTKTSSNPVITEAIYGAWTHVLMTYEQATGTVTGYVNGVNIGSQADAATAGGLESASTTDAWNFIGEHPSDWWMDLLVDDLRIYSRALSEDEVLELYRMGGVGQTVSSTGSSTSYSSIQCAHPNYNLIDNGNFEENDDSWSGRHDAQYGVSSSAHNGSLSMLIEGGTYTDIDVPEVYQSVDVEAGKTYILSYWAKSEDYTDYTFYARLGDSYGAVQFLPLPSDAQADGDAFGNTHYDFDWVHIKQEFFLPSYAGDLSQAELRFINIGKYYNKVLIDDVVLYMEGRACSCYDDQSSSDSTSSDCSYYGSSVSCGYSESSTSSTSSDCFYYGSSSSCGYSGSSISSYSSSESYDDDDLPPLFPLDETATTELNWNAGWNFLSVPIHDTLYSYQLDGYDAMWVYVKQRWFLNPSRISSGLAFWMKSSTNGSKTLSGSIYEPDIANLEEGWHMLGTGKQFTQPKETYSNVKTTWKYDTTEGWLKNPDTIEPGQGFWLKSTGVSSENSDSSSASLSAVKTTLSHDGFDFSSGTTPSDYTLHDGSTMVWAACEYPDGMEWGDALWFHEIQNRIQDMGAVALSNITSAPTSGWDGCTGADQPLEVGHVYTLKLQDGYAKFEVLSINLEEWTAEVNYVYSTDGKF